MLNIPESIKTLFKTDGVFKNFRVHFPNGEHADLTNSDIVSESVKFTESICSKEVFQFGLSERSQIEFECVNMPNIYGVTIECGIEIDTSSLSASEIADIQSGTYDGELVLQADSDIGFGYYHIPYGTFIVESCPRSHGAMWRRKVTAYSVYGGVVYPIQSFVDSVNPYSEMVFRPAALKFISGDQTGYVRDNLSGMTDTVIADGFYRASGSHMRIEVVGFDYTLVTIESGSNPFREDFGVFDFESDVEAMDAVGVAVAQAVQEIAGNLIYNNSAVAIYDSTEQALRRKCPVLFKPVLASASIHGRASFDYSREIYSNQMTVLPGGVVTGRDYGGYHNVFIPKTVSSSLTVNVYTITGTIYAPVYTLYGTRTITVEPAEYAFYGATGYRYNGPSSELILANSATLKPSQTIENYYHVYTLNSDGTTTYKTANAYSFTGSTELEKIIDGVYELNGAFAKHARNNTLVSHTLGSEIDFAMTPSDYSELWWDDYSISSIGAVQYKYGETVAMYKFGLGESVYYMDDNEYLNSLAVEPDGGIESLLDTYFVQPASEISFIPFELDAIGLPFLEAGDRISIDIGTGETIETYILTRTISGIQVLTDSIDAKGGEVMGNGS